MKKYPFDYWIPYSILVSINKTHCTQCQVSHKRGMIEAYGVRKDDRINTSSVFFVESKCTCGFRMIRQYKTGPKNFKELLIVLLEEVQKREELELSMDTAEYTTGKISDKEANDFIRFLKKKNTSHEDFYVQIGGKIEDLGIEEISSNNKKTSIKKRKTPKKPVKKNSPKKKKE